MNASRKKKTWAPLRVRAAMKKSGLTCGDVAQHLSIQGYRASPEAVSAWTRKSSLGPYHAIGAAMLLEVVGL